MASLRNLLSNNTVDVGKLLSLYNSDNLSYDDKMGIVLKILTNSSLVIDAYDNHSNELRNFKYEMEVVTLYNYQATSDIWKILIITMKHSYGIYFIYFLMVIL